MASPRSPSHDLHISVRPQEERESTEEIAAEASPAHGLDPEIRRALYVYLWDSASVFACASSFVLMFYLRTEMHHAGKYGYELQNLFEGVISLAAVYPFALKSRFVNGDNHGEAIRKMAKSIPVYLPLNILYQPTKDWWVAVNASGSFAHFDFMEYGSATYEPLEALGTLGAYGGGFGFVYYALSKLMGLPVTVLDVVKTGSQYYLSYLIGAAFNTDLSVGVSRLPNVLYTGLTLATANFAYDVMTNKAMMVGLRNHLSYGSVPQAEVKAEVSVALEEDDDDKRVRLLSLQEQKAASDEPVGRHKRWNRGCYDILKSYCFFWNKSETKYIQQVMPVSAAVLATSFKK